MYEPSDQQLADIRKRFTYHSPERGQPERYTALRDHAYQIAGEILVATPPGREQALALTHLEQAVMWANAAIARGESDA